MSQNPATLFVGQTVILKDLIDSTNNLAASLIADSRLPEGAVIVTKGQNAGRGQQGTTWESEYDKNLLASFVFYPSLLEPKNIFLLNITFSLALHDFASKLLNNISIKWPNDLYCGNKKLAGMLIENSIRNNLFNYTILGIGLNVNQINFTANAANATSIKVELKKDMDVLNVLNLLCESIEARYLQLKSGNISTLKSEYIKILYQFGIPASYKAGEKVFQARIVQVSDDGKLVLEREDEKKEEYGFKEISFV